MGQPSKAMLHSFSSSSKCLREATSPAGAGQSVGYVDLPIQREPHTRIPIVPGRSFQGVLRDRDEFDVETKKWLFGHENGETDQTQFRAGAMLIGEARVPVFPYAPPKAASRGSPAPSRSPVTHAMQSPRTTKANRSRRHSMD